MSFASNMQNVALKLLTQKGEDYAINIIRVEEGAFNPADGTTGSDSTTSFTGRGYPYPFSKFEINNTTIFSTDIKLLIRTEQEIIVGDTIVLRDVDYRVMNVSDIGAQAQNIVYEVHLRA